MGTTLSDIIVPELFNPYVIQKTLEKSALVQSGIVQNDAEFDKLASQASPLVNMPFFSDQQVNRKRLSRAMTLPPIKSAVRKTLR